ncbi:ArsR/SmtB family transcription factor [Amycolatopsis aidingensis]|uniref:ArsR/SmtB family transcription factor n=1 Tax=Amycolatopsis aidingensis TaxID=2842453 RepID=UPI001C0E2DA6|nr:metalloregulator ArsR/SmtB family transcription factor [Amycolatopsis aidingensis]
MDAVTKPMVFDQIARVGKALASGKRLELLDLLAQAERTVEGLARAAGLGVTTTSAHLQTLKQGGLVATRKEGTRVFYQLASSEVAALYAAVRDVATTHLADVTAAVTAFLGPEVERVTRAELLARADRGEVTVLDVRPKVEYAAGHIPGALNIPLDELPDRLDELPEGTEIVAYCRGAQCVLAPDAVRLLADQGRPASRLADGMLEWRLAELPVEGGAR